MESIAKLVTPQLDLYERLIKAERNFRKTGKDKLKKSFIETRLEAVEELWKDFKKGHKEIMTNTSKEQRDKDEYFRNDIYDQFQEQYLSYKSLLKELYQMFTVTESHTKTSIPSNYDCNDVVKLPRIELPTFSGKYQEWQAFYDMFLSVIHNNSNLPLVQKLHYLKSCLSGEPELLIRNFSTTDANYIEAWEQLLKRYNNKKYNCNSIMQTLFSLKPLQTESSTALKNLLDTTSSCLKSLDNIGVKTETWDAIIVYMVVSKLDNESLKQCEYQLSLMSDELPTWSQLTVFLESRFRSLEMIEGTKTSNKNAVQTVKQTLKTKSFNATIEEEKKNNGITCLCCNGSHHVCHCKQFGSKSIQDRYGLVQSKRLCFNCLGSTHVVKNCKQSTSCRKCGRRHHSLLHVIKEQEGATSNTITPNTNTSGIMSTEYAKPIAAEKAKKKAAAPSDTHIVVNFSKNEQHQSYNVLLATAVIKAKSRSSIKHVIRALLDQGSQASFVSESTVQLLGLKRIPISGWVSGLGNGQTRIKHMVSLNVESNYNSNNNVQVKAYVLSALPSTLPSREILSPTWVPLEKVQLADPTYKTPGKIDILLGAEVYSDILLSGVMKHPQGHLLAQNTILGWIISGRMSQKDTSKNVISLHIQTRIDDLLKQFWEVENEHPSIKKKTTSDEQKCEEIFETTTVKAKDGRYVVRLPSNSEDLECQYSKHRKIAETRLSYLEARLEKKAQLYEDLLAEWLAYRKELEEIKDICIPRWLNYLPGYRTELHAFADASMSAYAGSVYLRVIDENNQVSVNLLSDKTKVAPIEKEMSVPRLELSGAVIATKLLCEIAEVMGISKENQYAWADSTVVLAWLKGPACRWTTFVSNRVSKILTMTDYEQWGYVSTHMNPSASRGLKPSELAEHSLWWYGPTWLKEPFMKKRLAEVKDTHEEEKVKALCTLQQPEKIEKPWERFSSFTRMLKVLSYCRRILNLKLLKTDRMNIKNYITVEEMNQTLKKCIKEVQEHEFGEEIKHLKAQKSVPRKSVLHPFCPIFDENEILRVGGRINLSDASYEKKHPIIMPGKNHLTKLIVADAHTKTMHGGPQLMLNHIRANYRIITVRDLVKKHYRQCVTCVRLSKANTTPFMGQIPAARLKTSKLFKSCGLDYAGPISLRFSPGRGTKVYRGYIALFVCMVTHALHLEVVSDLTSKGFIAAFKRMIARRGHCQDLYSDNGTNFTGASRELVEMFNSAKSNLPDEIAQLLTLENTNWHFIPPAAPNFGGLWEAGVRSVKTS